MTGAQLYTDTRLPFSYDREEEVDVCRDSLVQQVAAAKFCATTAS